MKKYFYALCMATALGTVGCSDDEVPGELDNSMKTPIQFSMTDEGGSAITKAGFMTRAGFARNTAIVMKMKSVHSTNTSDVKYTVTNAVAEKENSDKQYSEVKFDNTSGINQRYWDDAHGRNSQLSIFAVAVPNQPTASEQLKLNGSSTADPWFTEADENLKIDWEVTKTSTTADKINKEDLVYSNNIQEGSSENGVVKWDFDNSSYKVYDGEHFATQLAPGTMKFQLKEAAREDGPGKFDTGHLNFKHALSRVTLNIKADEGFAPADYADDKVKEVHLNSVPYKGTFNVQKGTWTVTDADKANVDLVKETLEAGSTYQLKYTGQIVPEYVIQKGNENVNMLQFTINNNVYYVTDKMVYDALNRDNATSLASDKDDSDNIVMKPGKNYVLNITVNKTKIEKITATLADWLPVTGNHTQNNAYLTFTNFVEKGSHCSDFDLYRIEDNSSTPSTTPGEHTSKKWYTGYTVSGAKATLTDKGSNTWATNWFFESNIHFYHFRTVSKSLTTEIKQGTEATEPKDYFEIQTGKDYHWGAPMIKNGGKDPKYDLNKGYEDFIHYAIGATESTIKLQEFHMMSQVDIVLTTTTGADQVSLYDEDTKTGTTVKITKIFQNGKVEMGRGLVSTTGTTSDYNVTSPKTTSADTYYQTKPVDGTTAAVSKVYSSLVIPQELVETGTPDVYVGLEIQTPDKNMYYVVEKLSKIIAKVTDSDDGYNQENNKAIERWYPGHHYTYTLTLKKTGIDKITCSLANWKEISGSSDVTLED